MKELRDSLNALFLNLPAKPFFAAKKTDPQALRELLRALNPVLTDKPLIRLGPNADGGYLVPDDLEGITSCFSPGVSTVSGFELECAARGMDVFLADASVDAPPDSHPRFKFLKKFIGAYSRNEFITMQDWIEAVEPDASGDWLLQIDIEGAEYEVMLNLAERHLRQFRIIVIEFHVLDYLFDSGFYAIASRAFEKILHQHTCVHIHPNNAGATVVSDDMVIPKIMEFTFYRNDRFVAMGPARSYPHELDVDNMSEFPVITLPPCWYQPEGL
jgi:hypothetical protein